MTSDLATRSSQVRTLLALVVLMFLFLAFSQIRRSWTLPWHITAFGHELIVRPVIPSLPPRPLAITTLRPLSLPAATLNINLTEAELLPPPPPCDCYDEEMPEPEVFVVVEQMPQLVGGLASIQRHLRYPASARRAGVQGRVIVQFVVDEEGKIQNPRVVRGIEAGCDEEAVRVVQTLRFTPGKQRGKVVKVKMSLPITFKLSA